MYMLTRNTWFIYVFTHNYRLFRTFPPKKNRNQRFVCSAFFRRILSNMYFISDFKWESNCSPIKLHESAWTCQKQRNRCSGEFYSQVVYWYFIQIQKQKAVKDSASICCFNLAGPDEVIHIPRLHCFSNPGQTLLKTHPWGIRLTRVDTYLSRRILVIFFG